MQISSKAQTSSTMANFDDSPEVIFVKSSRPLRNNSSSTSSANVVFHVPAYGVYEAACHDLIDVDSLGSPATGSVHIMLLLSLSLSWKALAQYFGTLAVLGTILYVILQVS